MLANINMVEVAGTSIEAKDHPQVAQFTRLLATKTAPVFKAESSEEHCFSEVVAVTYRADDGKPVHGGLFGVANDQTVVSLALKDLEGKVDTSEDPAHVAIGLTLMRGPLVFRQAGVDQKMELSIIDIYANKRDEPLRHPTPGREAVKQAYLAAFQAPK